MTYGDGRFVAVSQDGTVAHSDDGGATWTNDSIPGAESLQLPAFGAGVFLAGDSAGAVTFVVPVED